MTPPEILEQMYRKGVMKKHENETKWNLNSDSQRWRSTAMHALTQAFHDIGIEGVRHQFAQADRNGSGDLEVSRHTKVNI